MVASRDPADHVSPEPPFEPGHLEAVARDPEREHDADVGDQVPSDAVETFPGRPAAEQAGREDRAADQGGDGGRPRRQGLPELQVPELEVVDRHDGIAVDVEHLPVEEMQPGVEDPAGDLGRAGE